MEVASEVPPRLSKFVACVLRKLEQETTGKNWLKRERERERGGNKKMQKYKL